MVSQERVGQVREVDYPFESKYMEVDGGHRLHYVDEGEGAPVVMVHGNPSWSFYYRNLLKRLRKRRRALAVDHIGCGWSSRPALDEYSYELERRVADFGAFMDEVVGEEKVSLVMHDWGGMIGMAWAVRHPRRVERLVLLNTAAFHLPESKRLPWTLRLVRNTGLGAGLVKHFNAFSRGATRFCVTGGMEEAVKKGYLAPYEGPSERRLATLKFVQTIPLEPGDAGYELVSETESRLGDLGDKPIFIGWGHKDFVFDRHFLARWKEIYPQARYEEFADGGHYILEDRGEELGRSIESFLCDE